MPGKTYSWPRFWHVPGELPLDSHGFLIDPLSDYGRYLGTKSLDDITEISCLVLLGEPGMGKTHAMKAAQEKVSSPLLQIELGKQSSVEELSRRLFKAPTFRQWRKGEDVLYLFLDALDEGRLLIETIHHFLVAELRDLPKADLRNRLRFRISCRTADWPDSFGEELKELWREDAFGVYQLAPLRREDIQEAAFQEGLDPEKFLTEVMRREVGPLAARPVTLKMLLDVYKEGQTLPVRQIDLYERGCLRLCEEPNQDRRERRRGGELEAPERLEIASRIAAMMVFGNRRLIRRNSLESPREGEISIRDLAGNHEPVQGKSLPVGEGAIADVLRHSALFVGAGDGLSTWAHQTYSEFLAARYLVCREVSSEKIIALITHPEDPERKIAPQLHEVAAWLAGLSGEVFADILDREPEVLLRSDVTGVTSESRARLVAEFLRRLDLGELYLAWDIAKYFHKLDHSGLPAQLRPYISDRARRKDAREAAIVIAGRASGCQQLAPDLLRLALSPDEPEGLRADAISALGNIADENIKAQLMPLVASESPASHFLKSRALRVLWPSHLSSTELFSILGIVRNKEDLRHYQLFLAGDFAKDLKGASIIPALQWVGEMGGFRRSERVYLENAARRVMKSSWEYFEEPEVVEAFARMLIKLSERHVRFDVGEVSSLFKADDERRRKLLTCVFDIFAQDVGISLWVLTWPWSPLNEDTYWLLDRLYRTEEQGLKELLARLIARTYNRANRKQVRAVASAAKSYPVLKSILQGDAKQRRQLHRFERQRKAAIEEEELVKAQRQARLGRPVDHVNRFLDEFENGDHAAWWKIDYWLRVSEDLEHELSDFRGDLSESPGWSVADEEKRGRIVSYAREYILFGDPQTESWNDPEPGITYRIPMAAYRAFRLIPQGSVKLIEPVHWKRWAPALLHFLAQGGTDNQEARDVLLRNLALHAADEVNVGLSRVLDRKIAVGKSLHFLENLSAVFDRRLLELLWSHFPLQTPLTEASTFLLKLLLRNNFDPAYEYAARVVNRWSKGGDEDEERALTMARLLVSEGKGCGWDVVWPLCLEKPDFGRKLWLTLGAESGHIGLREIHLLPPRFLGQLLQWLLEHFPVDVAETESSLSDEDEVVLLRGRIIRLLVGSGTAEACAVLEDLSRSRPEWIGLKYSVFEARQNFRLKSYPWPAPRQVLEMALDAKIRIVRTESELLSAIVEALRKLQGEFKQETPAAIDLWNEWGGKAKAYRPKSENQISDYVKRYLDRVLPGFGVIVNREVENRARVGAQGEPGERTDILVNVRVPETEAELTVIVETKGCWHDELLTAMKTQLLDRYMKDNFCRHGLYLVCWFNCPQWDVKDSRWRKAKDLDLGSVEMALAKQADQLSAGSSTRLSAFVLDAALR